MRIFACSDLHVDHQPNWKWIQDLEPGSHTEEALIVAGDISTDLTQLTRCLQHLTGVFSHVFYCPGNHEMWLNTTEGFNTSVEKFDRILGICAQLGVQTEAQRLDDVWVVPLFSWYDDSLIGADDVINRKVLGDCWVDYHLCKFPESVASPAKYFADRNSYAVRGDYDAPVVSFSHMMPRRDLMVPQCFLHFTDLPAVAGTHLLEEQIRTIGSQVHVFGHTHMNHVAFLDNCLYVQNSFGYPRERERTGRKPCFRPVWPLNENAC
ncbi:putative serine/threonine protein phosphatase [Paratrimastix pyriformis]|uniref:Serine/threonine protein phosphatase n=1 Tax=Paratrimastix pyriformis TaxID=342808 RepID=A0ABQ8UM61_9EUKA|nr:putative serine/threonine protein phosphatase [Paratrimastix pyriformis]